MGTVILIVAIALGGLVGSSVTPTDTLSKEIDHDLGVVCYWTARNDISCIPLNQTNYEEGGNGR